jgi:hypothetical protein
VTDAGRSHAAGLGALVFLEQQAIQVAVTSLHRGHAEAGSVNGSTETLHTRGFGSDPQTGHVSFSEQSESLKHPYPDPEPESELEQPEAIHLDEPEVEVRGSADRIGIDVRDGDGAAWTTVAAGCTEAGTEAAVLGDTGTRPAGADEPIGRSAETGRRGGADVQLANASARSKATERRGCGPFGRVGTGTLFGTARCSLGLIREYRASRAAAPASAIARSGRRSSADGLEESGE